MIGQRNKWNVLGHTMMVMMVTVSNKVIIENRLDRIAINPWPMKAHGLIRTCMTSLSGTCSGNDFQELFYFMCLACLWKQHHFFCGHFTNIKHPITITLTQKFWHASLSVWTWWGIPDTVPVVVGNDMKDENNQLSRLRCFFPFLKPEPKTTLWAMGWLSGWYICNLNLKIRGFVRRHELNKRWKCLLPPVLS